jgi:hypothetical protein
VLLEHVLVGELHVPIDVLQPGRLAKVDELVVDEAILPPSGLSSPLAPSTRRRRQWI